MKAVFRLAVVEDLPALLALEMQCFTTDRLTSRSFQWMITRAHAQLLVAECDGQLLRLRAGAVSSRHLAGAAVFHCDCRSKRAASVWASNCWQRIEAHARWSMIAPICAWKCASTTPRPLRLYERNGYRRFALIHDYYEDHADALRLEKRILQHRDSRSIKVPYYPQTTDFTCGPACLLMAMGALQPARVLERREELQIWREATTVFMTSGHGGCSPQGLALAAWRRGFRGAPAGEYGRAVVSRWRARCA